MRVRSHTSVCAHVPAHKLQSFDTPEGFEQHRQWEKTLAAGNWGMVTWPKEFGGRACDLIEWLIFEEEYNLILYEDTLSVINYCIYYDLIK